MWLRSAWAVGVLVVGACVAQAHAASTEVLSPVHRLVRPSEKGSTLPVETIQNDLRPVLAAYPSRWLGGHQVTIGEDGVLDFEAGAISNERILTGLLGPTGRSTTLRVAPNQKPTLHFEGVSPGKLRLRLRGRDVPPPTTRYESEPVLIPADAVLELSTGILDIASGQGAVEFAIDACRAEDDCRTLFRRVESPGRPWTDHRLSLAELGGATVRLRFTTALEDDDAGAWSFPVWGDPVIWAPERQPKRPPNLIVLSIDTLRADHLTSYGYDRDTAPFLDRFFAKEGVVFDQTVAAATTTGPSHMTMLTGLQPSVHGVHAESYRTQLPSGVRTLAEILRERGFETAAVTENGPMGAARGFARGFGRYRENKGTHSKDRTGGFVEATLGAGADFVRAHHRKPFFLFLHTFEVHTPYDPPEKYASFFEEDLPGDDGKPIWRPTNYDREIRFTDDAVQAFVAGIDVAGLWDDTLFVVISDHGEAFGEHGLRFHGGVPYDEVLRVPWMVRGPGIPPGKRIHEVVSLVDFTPTVLDLMGVPAPAKTMGRSVAPLVRVADEDWAVRPVFSEAQARKASGKHGTRDVEIGGAMVVRVGDRKLIRRGDGGIEYYDLSADPGEKENLWTEKRSDAEPLVDLIDEYVVSSGSQRARLEAGGATPPTEPLSPERTEKLRALGYID